MIRFAQSPSLKRRCRGEGSGSIQRHFVEHHKQGKSRYYAQYWYHYELWQDGQCLVKSSVYIPQTKLYRIQQMNANKESVKAILKELGKIL